MLLAEREGCSGVAIWLARLLEIVASLCDISIRRLPAFPFQTQLGRHADLARD
jgi:hypothetical protein